MANVQYYDVILKPVVTENLQRIAQISRSSRDYKIAKHTDRNRDNKQLKGDLSWELKHTAHIRLPEDR